jgi:hypothetical protein
MRYSLHEIDKHQVVATIAADRDEALEWFSEKLRLMLTFEGNPVAAEYLLDEWPESLPSVAHTPKPTIPVFVVRAVAAHHHKALGVVRLAVEQGPRQLEWISACLGRIRTCEGSAASQ